MKVSSHSANLVSPKKLVGFQTQVAQDDETLLTAVTRLLEQGPNGLGFPSGCLELIRNHPRIVTHIPEILLVWRGNTDAQIVKSYKQLLQYILKYMFKPETGSETFTNVVRSLTENCEDESPVRKLFCRVLLKTLNEHDMHPLWRHLDAQ